MADQTVALQVICTHPPAGAFGLQDKQRNIVAGESLSGGRLRFDLRLKVKQNADGTPNFTGSYAHGPPSERFLYLTSLDPAGQIRRRIKVPLKTITWAQVAAVLDDGTACLSAEVEGQRSGTVPLLGEGWTLAAKT